MSTAAAVTSMALGKDNRRGAARETYRILRTSPGVDFTAAQVANMLGVDEVAVNGALAHLAKNYRGKNGLVRMPGVERTGRGRYRYSTGRRDAIVADQGGRDPWAEKTEGHRPPAPVQQPATTVVVRSGQRSSYGELMMLRQISGTLWMDEDTERVYRLTELTE